MSKIVSTPLGRMRQVWNTPTDPEWLWECACGTWCHLSNDQWLGTVSVNHASQGCAAGYHETHSYAAALHDALFGQPHR